MLAWPTWPCHEEPVQAFLSPLDSRYAHEGVLKRVGLGPASNEEYEDRSTREVRRKMRDLDEIGRGIKEQLKNCWTEIRIVEHDVKKEEERNMVSNLITQEIAQFKEDWRLKMREEDEAKLRKKLSY